MSQFWNRLRLVSDLLKFSSSSLPSVRHLRGNPPETAKNLKQRLEEMAKMEKDPSIHFRVNIGIPHLRPSRREEYQQRMDFLKERKASSFQNEKFSLSDVRHEWLKTCGPYHIKRLAEHFNIFEDLFGEAYFVPRVPLDIKFQVEDGSLLPVCFGNQVKPAEAKSSPKVTFESDPSSMWSLLLVNPDGHFTEQNAEYVHWFIGNIPGNDITKGEEIVSYLQPFPPRGTGSQRLVFILYKQDKTVDLSAFRKTAPCLELADRTFRNKEFYRTFQDAITPAGLAFFQCDWDHSLTEFFHNTLNMQEPIYEYDFPEQFKKPPVWFPKRKPFNLYMDHHRDPKQIAKELLLKRLKSVDPFKPKDPDPKYPNALPEDNKLPSWLRTEIRKQRLKWGRYSDM